MTQVRWSAYSDNRGRKPQVGDSVVANVSGQLGAGMVVSVGRRGFGPFRVELYHPAAGNPAGHVSIIKSAKSLLVIEPEDFVRPQRRNTIQGETRA